MILLLLIDNRLGILQLYKKHATSVVDVSVVDVVRGKDLSSIVREVWSPDVVGGENLFSLMREVESQQVHNFKLCRYFAHKRYYTIALLRLSVRHQSSYRIQTKVEIVEMSCILMNFVPITISVTVSYLMHCIIYVYMGIW